jgi:ubiquinone/menaquinone biosynthesis C-methylase UbiE
MSETSTTLNFSGSVPRNYDEHLGPMFFEPYAIDIEQRIDPSASDVLELSCGTGRVTRHLRKILSPSARLVASDLSPDMMAVAQQKLADLNIEWRIIDAEKLPFDSNSMDVIVCYFGYMFVCDRDKAFAEAFRVLKEKGTLLFATWDKLERNEASHVFRKIVKQYLGDSLPEFCKLPFSMSDCTSIKDALKQVGFSKVSCETVEKQSYCDTAAKAADGLVKGGSIYNEILKTNPDMVGEIISTVQNELSEKYGSAPMRVPMSALVTQAWK